MKLTISQIVMLTEACREAARTYDQRAAADPSPEMQAYWRGEAATARHLESLLRQTTSAELELMSPPAVNDRQPR